jgi:hypothetical protein
VAVENTWLPVQGSVPRDRKGALPNPFVIPGPQYSSSVSWAPVGGPYGPLPGDPAWYSGPPLLGGACGVSAPPRAARPAR